MPPNRSTRSARTGDIPEHFIVNWRKSGPSGPKPSPLVRRPVTACEHCHAAKVRCNARQDCQRCIARRLVCTYTHQTAGSGALDSGSSSQAGQGLAASLPASEPTHATGTQVQSQQTPPLVDTSHTPAGTAAPDYIGNASAAVDYGPATNLNMASVVSLGWDNTIPSDSQSGLLGSNSTPYVGDTTAQHSACLHDNYGPLLVSSIDGGSGPRNESPTTVLGQQADLQFFSQDAPACPCRPNLMIWVSKIARVVQDRRPDEILKVTGEVTRYCQDVLDCKTDEARCSDLLLIMSVLQETRPCFDFIAKSGFLEGQGGDAKVKLCFGDYEVALDNAGVRATLAMDLVRRAAAVVTSISSKGQCMINGLPEPCNLAMANIAYLEANIGHFKGMLACVVRHVDEVVNKDGGGLDVSELLLRNTRQCQTEGRASS